MVAILAGFYRFLIVGRSAFDDGKTSNYLNFAPNTLTLSSLRRGCGFDD